MGKRGKKWGGGRGLLTIKTFRTTYLREQVRKAYLGKLPTIFKDRKKERTRQKSHKTESSTRGSINTNHQAEQKPKWEKLRRKISRQMRETIMCYKGMDSKKKGEYETRESKPIMCDI